MSSTIDHQGFTVCGPDDDDLGYTSWGVFDADQDDFVAAFTYSRDADDKAAALEQREHDFGARGVDAAFTGRYHPRYSVDRLPADHPLADVTP